jgi:hypothetical protein
MNDDLGPLAAALAKAQMDFPPIKRDKTVTVQTKTGGSYSFAYAPLDTILAAVRKPLADNGLCIVQILDDDGQPILVTRLLHDSGASLTGRMAIPATPGIQELGSAITYLRRYAIQAVLGIAAEEDDDGNRAAGNRATPAARGRAQTAPAAAGATETTEAAPAVHSDGSLIGTVAIGSAWLEDLETRTTPTGPVIGFRLKSGRQTQKVQAFGPMAVALGGLGTDLIGQTVTCWGTMVGAEFTPKGTDRPIEYQVLRLKKIHGATFDIPATESRAVPDEDDPECGSVAAPGTLMEGAVCTLLPHATGPHKSANGSWPA